MSRAVQVAVDALSEKINTLTTTLQGSAGDLAAQIKANTEALVEQSKASHALARAQLVLSGILTFAVVVQAAIALASCPGRDAPGDPPTSSAVGGPQSEDAEQEVTPPE